MKLFLVLFLGFSLTSFGQKDNSDLAITSSQDSTPFFQFLLKENGDIFYSYDSMNLDRGLVAIEKPTKEKLIQALNAVEKKYQIKLTGVDIIIRADAKIAFKQVKFVKEALKEKQLFRFRVVTIEKPGVSFPVNPKKEDMESIISLSQKTLIIILAVNNELYYYHGSNCEKLLKTDFKLVKEILKAERKNTTVKDLFILIKATKESTFKNAIDLLDDIVLSKIPAGQYAEVDITAAEINCIKNFKNQ